MTVFSNRSRAGVAVAAPLMAACLLALPRTTDERSAPRPPGAAPPAVAAAPQPPASGIRAGAAATGPRALRTAAQARPSSTQRPGMAGMVVGIDPETGEVGMPTPEQMKALSGSHGYQIDHSAAGLVEVHHPDGSVSVDLQGRFQEYETVRIGPDGKKVFQCVDGEENVKRAVESPAPPAAEER